MQDLPGYSIEKTLHSSPSSAVYRARRDSDGLAVVLKFPQATPVPARQLTRYHNEFEILSSFRSARVVAAIDLVRHAHTLALVLEDFDGVPLSQWTRAKKPSTIERLQAAVQISRALCDVHDAGIIHKDINNRNLLIDAASSTIKMIDFGIASRLKSEQSGFQAAAALEGTLAYIAPEQTGRMNRSTDQRADLYSLGITLFELFSDRLPHDSDDPLELVHFHIAGKFPSLSDAAPQLPAQIAKIVERLLQKSPEDRYQSAAGLTDDLESCLEQLQSVGSIDAFEPGRNDRVNRFHLPERLYGREDEVTSLRRAFERAAGGGVECVQIAGDPGAGKTTLVRELYPAVTQRRGYFCSGRFDQLRRSAPFSALVDALQGLVSQLLTETEESLQTWQSRILQATGDNGRIILDVIPSLELIIGEQPPVAELTGAEARNRFEHTFLRFLQVFARREHPLVIFMDDAQWADQASLALSNLLLCAPDTEALLIVQAFRSDEVSSTHPLMSATEYLRDHAREPLRIDPGPLRSQDICHYVADTLHRSPESVADLAKIVEKKTGGNAFFIGQFLTTLHDDGQIGFSSQSQHFEFDLDAISNTAITENVAALLTRRLQELPEETLKLLRIAAVIGRRFDLATMATVLQLSEPQVAEDLQPGVAAEVIVPVSRLESLRSNGSETSLGYRQMQFLHDRLQQAAYETIAEHDRDRIHLEIGRACLSDESDSRDDHNLFDTVNHLNKGMRLIVDAKEQTRLARLNLRASVSARKSTAYALAVDLCEKAIAVLGGSECWQRDPDLAFSLHAELAEALSLDAKHETALEVLQTALGHASEPLQAARIYALQLGSLLGSGDMPGALQTGRTALQELGVHLPDDADQIESALKHDIAEILRRTDELGHKRLLDLPRMESPLEIKLMELMAHCMPAAYQTNKQLFSLICSRMVLLSLDRGHCPLSARAYTSFGALLSGVLGEYSKAFQFTRLAIDLAERLDDPTVLAGVYMVHGLFVCHWNEPIDASIAAFRKSIDLGVQHGDHVHASYAIARKVCYEQVRGAPLQATRQEAVSAIARIESFGDPANVAFIEARLALMDWLIDGGEISLSTPEKSEAARIEEARARGNYSFASDLMIVMLEQRTFAGAWQEAFELLRQSEEYIAFSSAFATQVQHSFYAALTISALIQSGDEAMRDELLSTLESHLGKLQGWADQSADNYGHMYLLAAAEHAHIQDNALTAMRLYDEAIDQATKAGFVHIEGLAAERAAAFWSSRKKPEFSRL